MKTPLIIAEVGQAHDGSLGQAHAFIDAIAESGADVVKFQMHIASEESTTADKFRIPFFCIGTTGSIIITTPSETRSIKCSIGSVIIIVVVVVHRIVTWVIT